MSPAEAGSHRRCLPAALAVAVAAVAVTSVTLLAGGAGTGRPLPTHGSTQPTASTSPAVRAAPASPPVASSSATTVRGADAPSPASLRRPAAPMTRSVPTRLLIPSIGVDSDLVPLGLEPDGTLETPPGPFPAGWFTGAPTPGEIGPAIIVGHVRYNTPGVFARLSQLRTGQDIRVEREDRSTATFEVTGVEHVDKTAFPTRAVYGNLDHAGLRLITCAGLDSSGEVFEENLVVFADLVAG